MSSNISGNHHGDDQKLTPFKVKLEEHSLELKRTSIETLQVNFGKRCNQACHHCHVEAGPNRTENMERETVDRLLELLEASNDIKTVDITGGAPELNPHFRHFVSNIRRLGVDVIDRCNLTVLFEEGQEETAEFLANHQVMVVASLPCYLEDNVDQQRGKGVFDKSIRGLQLLNELGYGVDGSGLYLNLVYNPVGTHLPPNQAELEQAYKEKLQQEFGIVFNQLFTITNMPINRFRHALIRDKDYHDYMRLLEDNFNPDAANNVMCKALVSIGWDGMIYDCDFNQMLNVGVNKQMLSIWDIGTLDDIPGDIFVANHCYGCTAGSGSSCGGSTV